jgi:hypothetical protein
MHVTHDQTYYSSWILQRLTLRHAVGTSSSVQVLCTRWGTFLRPRMTYASRARKRHTPLRILYPSTIAQSMDRAPILLPFGLIDSQ